MEIQSVFIDSEESTVEVKMLGEDGFMETLTLDMTAEELQRMLEYADDADEDSIEELVWEIINSQSKDPMDFLVEEYPEHFSKGEDGEILFNGHELEQAACNWLHDLKQRVDKSEAEIEGFIKFLYNLEENPSYNSRESLVSFLTAVQDIEEQFSITRDGMLIAYKGVDSELNSIHAGDAKVDGVQYRKKNIPNLPGSRVTFPRNLVDDNVNNGCSQGLHVGTFNYANDFGARVVKVKVNPRDVVSVPMDCECQKVRCCEYLVVEEVEKKLPENFDFEGEPEDTDNVTELVDSLLEENDLDSTEDVVRFLMEQLGKLVDKNNEKGEE